MRSERDDEKLMVQYLLGNLSVEEQVRIEDRAFSDSDYMGALEAAEADLIDAYVRDELSQSERRGFERRFLISPQRRSKVEFARDLARIAEELKAAEAAPSERPSGWLSLVGLVRAWHPALQFAVVLVALISVAVVAPVPTHNETTAIAVDTFKAQDRTFSAANKVETFLKPRLSVI
jgi:anti-sigma-K factor RskA